MSKKPAKKPARRSAKPAKKTKPARTPAKKASKGSPLGAVRNQLVADLAFAHATLESMAADIPAAKAFTRPDPAANHLGWQLGHLAMTYEWFTGLIDGSKPALPKSYHALFGFGSKPTDGPGGYPPLDELRAAFDRTYAAMVRAFTSLKESQIGAAPTGDASMMGKTRADIFARAAWHDGWHTGQISALRRGLGLPPKW